jgi:hypothetical protein
LVASASGVWVQWPSSSRSNKAIARSAGPDLPAPHLIVADSIVGLEGANWAKRVSAAAELRPTPGYSAPRARPMPGYSAPRAPLCAKRDSRAWRGHARPSKQDESRGSAEGFQVGARGPVRGRRLGREFPMRVDGMRFAARCTWRRAQRPRPCAS